MDAIGSIRSNLLQPQALNFLPTKDFPKVYGVLMDWTVDTQTSTAFALCDGTSGLYAPSVVLADKVLQERVKARAISLVKTAGSYYDFSVSTTDYTPPKAGIV